MTSKSMKTMPKYRNSSFPDVQDLESSANVSKFQLKAFLATMQIPATVVLRTEVLLTEVLLTEVLFTEVLLIEVLLTGVLTEVLLTDANELPKQVRCEASRNCGSTVLMTT